MRGITMRVICVDNRSNLLGNQLIEGKTYHVEGFFRPLHSGARYYLEGVSYSVPVNQFIPYDINFEIEKQIFDALK